MRLRDHLGSRQWVSFFLLILCSIVAYVTINNFQLLLVWFNGFFKRISPFLAGFIIAYLLDIPCSKIEQQLKDTQIPFITKRARGISVLIGYMLFILTIVVLMSIILPQIASSLSEFIASFPVYIQNTQKYLQDLLENDALISQIDFYAIADFISLNSILESFNAQTVWQYIMSLLNISTYLFNGIVAIISSIYLLLEAKQINQFFLKLLKAFVLEHHAHIIIKYVRKTNIYFKKYFYCLLLDGVLVGSLSVLGLMLMKAPYPVVLGVVAGVTNMIPYFGAIVGSIIVTVVILFTSGLAKALWVLLFLFVLQQIDGNVVKPKMFGDSFNISPFVVILSITIGGSYYGVMGMIIAIPVVAVLNGILQDILDYRIAKKKAGDDAPVFETVFGTTEDHL